MVVFLSLIHISSIQAAIELTSELDPEQVNGQIIIIPIVNVQGFQQRCSGIIPEDGKNINHLFPGSATGKMCIRDRN